MNNNSFDRTIKSLCSEIDDLHREVNYWKNMYEESQQQFINEQNKRYADVGETLSNTLKFISVIREDDEGNLTIKKEDRNIFDK